MRLLVNIGINANADTIVNMINNPTHFNSTTNVYISRSMIAIRMSTQALEFAQIGHYYYTYWYLLSNLLALFKLMFQLSNFFGTNFPTSLKVSRLGPTKFGSCKVGKVRKLKVGKLES